MPLSEFSVFLIFSLKPALSLSSFTLIKRLLSSSSLSAIRMVSLGIELHSIGQNKSQEQYRFKEREDGLHLSMEGVSRPGREEEADGGHLFTDSPL